MSISSRSVCVNMRFQRKKGLRLLHSLRPLIIKVWQGRILMETLKNDITLFFQDVQLETQNSVSRIRSEREETYLCRSSVQYVKPVRAINSKGKQISKSILNFLLTQYFHLSHCLDTVC